MEKKHFLFLFLLIISTTPLMQAGKPPYNFDETDKKELGADVQKFKKWIYTQLDDTYKSWRTDGIIAAIKYMVQTKGEENETDS